MPAYKVWKERKKEMSALNSISSDNILKNLEDRKTFKKNNKNSENLSLADMHHKERKVIRGKLQSSGKDKDHQNQHMYENIKEHILNSSLIFFIIYVINVGLMVYVKVN